MAIIMYRGKDGKLYPLVDSINVSGDDISSVYVGDAEPVDPKCKVWYDTSFATPIGKIYLDGEWVEVAGGGGGSSGGVNLNGITITPKWFGKTLAYGDNCDVEISWSSYYGGNPTGMIDYELLVKTPEGEERKEYERIVPEGTRTINLTNYLSLGSTEIILRVTNDRGKFAQAVLTVTAVKLEMYETFNEDRTYSSDVIKYYCTPNGVKNKEQKLYVELDGELIIDGQNIPENNQLQTCDLSVSTHGKHSVCAWFTCQLEEGKDPVPSNKVYSEFAYVTGGDATPIIIANCGVDKLEEYTNITFDWYVFTPNSDGTIVEYTPRVEIYHSSQSEIIDGEQPVSIVENVVRGDKQEHTFRAEYVGDNYIIFKVGAHTRPIYIGVTKSPFDINAVTTNLLLNLSPQYHRNNDPNRELWVSETPEGKITATLEGFNFRSDGWVVSDKSTVLRVRDDARVNIPVNIFTEDVSNTGMVIEFELATHDVLDYETTIIECMNSGIGIEVKANQAMLKTKNNTLITPFREGEQVRVTFVIESKNSATNLLLIYINGVMSGAKQYTSTDDFSQSVVQGIKIGSNLCATDIYAIRVYKTALGRRDILTNWIADTQDRELFLARYKRNNVFYNNELHPEYLPEGLAYMIFYTNEAGLPQAKGKGEERYLSGKFVDALRSFTFNGVQLKVQGTSSSGYPRKNFTQTYVDKDKEKVPIVFTGIRDDIEYIDEEFYDFKMFNNSIPVNSFCFKADYASSEGANNVELVKLFNDLCLALGTKYQIPPQIDNENVRQGIDGFPMVIFCYHDNAYYFIGKYNFNNDKGTPEVYGMTEGVESFEITNNGTAMGEYKEDDFGTIIYKEETDPVTGQTIVKETEKWLDTFEARYPEDHEGYENLKEMVSWVRSTWRAEADDNRRLVEPVTYGEHTYEYDSVDYRRAKFINEVSDYFNVDHLCFFYLFTDFFLMIDNREKNTFPTRYYDKVLKKWLWYFLPYDFDTALGINNSGELVFGHGLEDYDEGVYNGADSVLWCNTRDYLSEKISELYVTLRSNGIFNYDEIVKRFVNHYRAWGEAVQNEDSYYKYIAIMFGANGTAEHLGKLQGNKEAQMKHWLFNRFRYYDAKHLTNDAKNEIIIIRPNYIDGGNNNHDIVITPYSDTYLAVNFDDMSGNKKPTPRRAYKGAPKTFKNPKDRPDNAVVHIYNASQIIDLGDLSGQYTSEFVGGSATRLQRLILGSDDTVNTELNKLTLGNNRLLKFLNVKNCPNLTGDIDISGCSGIEEVYFDGTSVTSVVLPEGGSCRILHLPQTTTNLTVLNHKVTEFVMPNYNNLSTLWLELNETSKNTFNLKEILNDMVDRFKASEEGELGRLRVTGFELTGDNAFETAQEVIDLYTDLRKYFRGMDANGTASRDETYLKNMLTGKIQIKEDTIYSAQLSTMKEMFPYVDIEYNNIASIVTFYVEEQIVHAAIVLNGGKCYDPVTEGIIDTPTKDETETTKYRFEGWVDAYGQRDDLTKVTADRTVYADIQGYTKYIITFVNIDTEHAVVSYIKGENIVSPAIPEKESTAEFNFVFKGWSLDGINVVELPKTMGEENLTYYAVYEAETRVYDIIWTYFNSSITTNCLYGKVPVVPDELKIGQNISYAGQTHPIKGYVDITEIEENLDKDYSILEPIYGSTTYVLLVEKEAVVSTGPSLVGAKSSNTPDLSAILDNNKDTYWESAYSTDYNFILYGFNFNELKNSKNIQLTDLNLEIQKSFCYDPNSSFYFVKNFETSGVIDSNYITADKKILGPVTIPNAGASDPSTGISCFFSKTELNDALEYLKTNIYDLIENSQSNKFGIYLDIHRKLSFGGIILTLSYTCDALAIDTNQRIVVWDIAGNTVIENYDLNETPVPPYSIGEKPIIKNKQYTITNWTPEIKPVTSYTIYTAEYEMTKYKIEFVNWDGSILSSTEYEYGAVPTYTGSDPIKEYYTFTGWSPAFAKVTGEATYVATYEPTVYTVTKKPTNVHHDRYDNPSYAYDNDLNSYAYHYSETGRTSEGFVDSGFDIPNNAEISKLIVSAKLYSSSDYGVAELGVGRKSSDSSVILYFYEVELFKNSQISPQYFEITVPLDEIKTKLIEEVGNDSIVKWLNCSDATCQFAVCTTIGSTGGLFNQKAAEVRIYDLYTTVEYTVP